jgi:hypothetical protein
MRAYGCKISKDLDIYDRVQPRMKVDIVGEIIEPIQTSVALTNVIVLAVDSVPIGNEKAPRVITVGVTPVQCEFLALMDKHGMKLAIRLRENEKPKK